MTQTITNGPLTLYCNDPLEVWRAETAFTKEPGTIAWLDQVQPGEVFFDVGANVGIYSLYAASKGAIVYAFEPHLPNAVSLMQHAASCGLSKRISVVTAAVSDECRWGPFTYHSLEVGSSASQFGGWPMSSRCGVVEQKWSVTLASFAKMLNSPALIKIDVDGIEAKIVQGLQGDACGARSVQVELRPTNRARVIALMQERGYRVDHVHYTANGQAAIAKGADPNDLEDNTVFVKA